MIRKRHPIKRSSQRRAARWRTLVAEVLESRYVLASAVLVVNSTADPGDGIANAAELTLREAIAAVNATPSTGSPTRIEFNIPASDPGHVYYRDDGLPGRVSVAKVMPTTAASDSELSNPDPDWPHSWFSIKPQDNLPAIASGVIVDGYTQPGARANSLAVGSDAVLRVELDGTNAEIPASGLRVGGDGNTIRGLAINRFQGDDYGESFGIEISAADNNVIEGNYLGTDVAGILDLGNAAGMYVWHSANNRIGGTTPSARNVISGNDGGGIRFALEGNHLVQGNYIGTTAMGTAPLGNGGSGVELINASSIMIGGDLPGAGNLIAYNEVDGVTVRVANLSATGNAILGNRLFSNAGLGIDLSPDVGVTLNDVGDTDTGANNRQNFPVLTSVQATLTATTIEGTLNSTPSTMYRIELFASAAVDPTGFGEGQTLLSSLEVTTDAAGVANFSALLPVAITAGQFITATATVQHSGSSGPRFGDTSEFSQAVIARAATGEIRGMVWHDIDTSGARGSDEPGLAGWTVFLDADQDQQLDTGERYTLTDSGGAYAFAGVSPGNYEVAQLVQPGWQQGYPLWIPRWVYVAEQVWRPRDLFNPGEFVANRIQIFHQTTLELIDSFSHAELDEGFVHDIEIGPGGDVYVAVELGQGHGQVAQFDYEGRYLRTIDLPDDGGAFQAYPIGFDVLPDGGLLIPQPESERLVWLNADGAVTRTLDVPGFRPIDAAVQSDGTVVFSEDSLLNVRSDDLFWAGSSAGAELRKRGGGVIWTRGDRAVQEALETPEGVLFAIDSALESPELFASFVHRLVKYDADGHELDHVELVGPVISEGNLPFLGIETNAVAKGLAVALSEVPFGEPVFAAGAVSATTENSTPLASRPQNSGRGVWQVIVEPGQVVQGADFGNVQFSTVSGVKFNDQNQDGVRDPGEPGLDGWVIYADLDDDGQRDGREPFDTTHDGGQYSISNVLPGTFKLREEPQLPWVQTAPALGYFEVVSTSGSVSTGLDFGNFLPLQLTGEIRGAVWHDKDTSSTRESDEPGVAGWTVFLDDDRDGQLDAGERSTATDGGGNYAFEGLAPGDYAVGQIPRRGWDLIHPLDVPEWIYVVEEDARTGLGGRDLENRIEIFNRNLLRQDTFSHPDFEAGTLADVESGPGGDVYVGVSLGAGQGRILQFTYEGEFVRTIELPVDEDLDPDEERLHYPLGFDVLADGSLLVARPNSHEIVELNPDGSIDVTYDLPLFRPLDAGVTSEGFLVWTDFRPDPLTGLTPDRHLNVRYDDLAWIGTTRGAELRDPITGELFDFRPFPFAIEALETSDGDLFATQFAGLARFTADGDLAAAARTNGFALGLAIALNEVPYGEPVRGEGLALAASQLALGAELLASEIPTPPAARALATGRGTWSVTLAAGQLATGADFGVVQLGAASGAVFSDANGDGVPSAVEPGQGGWVVYADLDDDGVHDGREPSATTAGGGFYTIEGIPPGTYKVREVLQPAWKQTGPALGYHEVHFQPGEAISGLGFGNQSCPADWLARSGEVLRILGDSHDDQVFVSVDSTGRLTVSAASDCFYEFTGIRRIVAEMRAGDDRLSFVGSLAPTQGPIALDLRLDQGDDWLSIKNWQGGLHTDLGAGDDKADLTYGGGTPDTSTLPMPLAAAVGLGSLELNVVAGRGNDEVNVSAEGFIDIALEIDLGEGDDRANVDIPPDSQSIAGKVRKLRATIVGGAGNDVTHSCIPMSTSDVLLDIDLGGGDDAALLELEGRFPAVSPTESHSLHGTIAAAAGNDDVQVLIGLSPPIPTPAVVPFDVFLDVDLGRGNDHFMFDVLPDSTSARGKVRELHLTVDAGVGDDVVQDCEPMTIATDALVEIDLGAGNDRFMLEQPALFIGPVGSDSSRLIVNVDAGTGNDAVEILFQPAAGLPSGLNLADLGPFDIFFNLNLGAGNDQAMVEWPTDPNHIVGKVRELHLRIDAGAGDDVVEDCDPATLPTAVFLDIDLGAGNDNLLIEQHGMPLGLTAGENGSLTANVVAGAGDDLVQILIGLLPPQVSDLIFQVDLGAGNDTADLRYGGGGPPDPAGKVRELHLNVLGGSGNDTINAVASAFFEVDVQANLGAGDDRFALSLNPDPLPVEDLTSIINVIIDAGSGSDGMVLDVERIALTEILVSILIMGVGPVSVDVLFPVGLLSVRQAGAGSSRTAGQSLIATKWDGSQLAADIRTGNTDDLVKLETDADPAADGSVRFSASTGGGNDSVQVVTSSFAGVSVDLDQGAGDDAADILVQKVREANLSVRGESGNDRINLRLESDVDPTADGSVRFLVDAGDGDDALNAVVNSVFDVQFDVDLGAGHDRAALHYAGGETPDPAGKVRELRSSLRGGSGNDNLQADISAYLADLVFVDLDGGTGNDAISVSFRDSAPSSVPPQPLHVHVLGGDGNDDLSHSAITNRSSALLDLLLDGGKGRDRGAATPNVKLKNCETVAPDTASVSGPSAQKASAPHRTRSSRRK